MHTHRATFLTDWRADLWRRDTLQYIFLCALLLASTPAPPPGHRIALQLSRLWQFFATLIHRRSPPYKPAEKLLDSVKRDMVS